MKLDRVLRGTLTLLIVLILVGAYHSKNSKFTNNSLNTQDIVYLAESQFDNYHRENVEIIEYTNNFNYPITISENNFDITCKGIGSNREDDELLTSNNFKIDTYFSKEKDGLKQESLTVKKKEKIYIFIVSKYDGEKYPTNEVVCNYNIGLLSAGSVE